MDKQINQKESIRPRCKKCSSTLTYIRIRDNIRRCRECGYEEDLK